LNKPKGKLLNEINNNQYHPSGRIPLLVKIVEQLEGQDREDLLEALDNTMYSAASIARALNLRGYNIKPAAINVYRRGEMVHVPKV
jgi:hypothetical protein